MKAKHLTIAACLLLLFAACKNSKKQKRAFLRDTSITKITSFNNLFFDSLGISIFLQAHPDLEPFEDQYQDFYKLRNFQYAWFDSKGITEQANHFLNLLNNTAQDLQDSSLVNPTLEGYYAKSMNDSLHQMSQDSLLITELLFTGQFFQYAAKVYKGSDLDAADLGWFIPRRKLDLATLLDSSIKSKAADITSFAALNPQYQKLQRQLASYYELLKTGTIAPIKKLQKPLKKGDSSQALILIKQKLLALGDLSGENNSPFFDSSLMVAAKHYQKRMGLSTNGSIGNQMIESLNTPIAKRIQQILVNMERLRWMPPQLDSNFIVVNIPEYKLHVYDSGKNVMDMNVIVGKAANGTVIFNGKLKFVVFSPYWNVPTSIVSKEIVPAMKKDGNYLERNHMEITGRSNGLPLVRQKPGEHNSLGLVKFLFPNNYDIYLHDTPNRDLFSQSSRSLSHGCIRISEPKKMAEYLLRHDKTWNSQNIDSAMHLAKEKWVTLQKSVPVFIVYFTAWVDNSGTLNFRNDIYGHDQKMSEKLFTDK
jgi:murein L,D-transpeptidase YcbB/YkuD